MNVAGVYLPVDVWPLLSWTRVILGSRTLSIVKTTVSLYLSLYLSLSVM